MHFSGDTHTPGTFLSYTVQAWLFQTGINQQPVPLLDHHHICLDLHTLKWVQTEGDPESIGTGDCSFGQRQGSVLPAILSIALCRWPGNIFSYTVTGQQMPLLNLVCILKARHNNKKETKQILPLNPCHYILPDHLIGEGTLWESANVEPPAWTRLLLLEMVHS